MKAGATDDKINMVAYNDRQNVDSRPVHAGSACSQQFVEEQLSLVNGFP